MIDKKWYCVLLLLLLAFSSPSVTAQVSGRATLNVSASHNDGRVNPTVGGRFGVLVVSDIAQFDFEGGYDRSRKIPGGGHSIVGEGVARIPLTKDFFVGPALSYSRQTTSLYTKDAFSIGAEAGWHSPVTKDTATTLSFRFLQDVKSVNKTRAYEGILRTYFKTNNRIGPYLSARVGLRDFGCFQGPVGLTDHCWSAHVGVGVGIFFKNH